MRSRENKKSENQQGNFADMITLVVLANRF
jgi:hypothetical protein